MTVISVVHQGDSVLISTVVSEEVDSLMLPVLVPAFQEVARSVPKNGDAAPLPVHPTIGTLYMSGNGAEVFADVPDSLSWGFRGIDRLYS
ncbi:hypothetical protein A8144_12690 [Mycobacterium leprae 3125609]|nr:hypothetical protein A8144_12690 [Mycobacterium leprae 3125609]OAX70328.1 hypothetical protein A3216_12610 [Mycobacterium leprae 7935681]